MFYFLLGYDFMQAYVLIPRVFFFSLLYWLSIPFKIWAASVNTHKLEISSSVSPSNCQSLPLSIFFIPPNKNYMLNNAFYSAVTSQWFPHQHLPPPPPFSSFFFFPLFFLDETITLPVTHFWNRIGVLSKILIRQPCYKTAKF